MLYAAISLRILSSTILHVWQKKLTQRTHDPVFVVTVMYLIVGLLGLPTLVFLRTEEIDASFWPAVIMAGMIDGIGNVFMTYGLKCIDLSVFGPLNAFTPVCAAIFGAVMLGELPSQEGLIGMLTIVGGAYLLVPPVSSRGCSRFQLLFSDPGVWFRFLSILMFAWGSVYLKRTVQTAPIWYAFYFWTLAGAAVSGLVWLAGARPRGASLKGQLERATGDDAKLFTAMALMNAPMQITTLVVFQYVLVGYAQALFQLGMLVHVVAGRMVFGEVYFLRRLAASAVMVGGSILILLKG